MTAAKAKTRPAPPQAQQWPADKIERWQTHKLLAYQRNARTHSDEQVAQIAASMKEFGWTIPILIDEDGIIIAGHGRTLAAAQLGINEVPVMIARGWTEAQKMAYRIADNRLPESAGWDADMLRLELTELGKMGFDLALTGFDDLELVQFMATPNVADPEETPEPPVNPVSRKGDLWMLGNHRLLCGDSLNKDEVDALLNGTVPDLANCDPPYGIGIVKRSSDGGAKPFGSQGRVHGLGRAGFGRVHGNAAKAIIQTGVYAEVIGDDSTDTAIASYQILMDIGVKRLVLWGGNYYAEALPPSRCWFVWDKEVTGTFADVELAWTNCDQVARLFRHQWNGLMKASEKGQARVHPTQKPVALAEWVIDTVTPRSRTVLDLFVGSGSTLIAAERKECSYFGMELAEPYVDVAVQRWQTYTGQEATLESTGETYAETAANRAHVEQKPKRAPKRPKPKKRTSKRAEAAE